MRRTSGLIIVMLAASALLGGCGIKLLSWEREIAMGLEAAPQMTAEFGGETPDAEVQAYVDEVGRRLLAGVDEDIPEDLPWEFTLLDSGVINAFALPGGQVYLSRGLAEKLKDEAEMAGVLGHEIGHVTARHGNQRVSSQILFNAGVAGAAVAVGVADKESRLRRYGTVAVPALAVGGNLVLLSYGRGEELEADELGMKYMAAAGYDPAGQRGVMETLKAASGPRSTPEWLSTHPASDTRIDRIDRLLAEQYGATRNNPSYVRNADAYERRMLSRLRGLPPAGHGSTQQSLLDNPALWCGHCAVAASSEKNLDQLLQAISEMSASL